ncbi:hypothetical protein SAY87_010511 [Trapa incisa]|uniref:Uncharacterized protein n=1 Tax=Trapa incisa TaxID=236973 RepID=A0AAN7GLL9_9MYRT|nr:hypothetical protein SAY87_010511 [Trapa incisa]
MTSVLFCTSSGHLIMVSIGHSGEDNFLLESATSEPLICSPYSSLSIEVPIYCFGEVLVTPDPLNNHLSSAYHNEESILDVLLLSQWEDRMWRGYFKYDVTSSEIRVIGGHLNFIAQLNQSYTKSHTPTLENIVLVSKKISVTDSTQCQKELLFCVTSSGMSKSKLTLSAIVPDNSLLIILNETLIDYGHVFLFPVTWTIRHLDVTLLESIVRMSVEINNPSFRLVYDFSHDSAQQLYFEACYFPNPLAVELMPVEVFFRDEKTGIQICDVLDYPIKTILFESRHNLRALVDTISQVSSKLLELKITYSILVSDHGRKIYMFLQANPCTLSAWECAGYLLFNSLYEFEEATEDSIFNLLCGASLDIEGFENVKQLCCRTHS